MLATFATRFALLFVMNFNPIYQFSIIFWSRLLFIIYQTRIEVSFLAIFSAYSLNCCLFLSNFSLKLIRSDFCHFRIQFDFIKDLSIYWFSIVFKSFCVWVSKSFYRNFLFWISNFYYSVFIQNLSILQKISLKRINFRLLQLFFIKLSSNYSFFLKAYLTKIIIK